MAYYIDLLPRDLRYELLNYIPMQDIITSFEEFGGNYGTYVMNNFYVKYISPSYWAYRLSINYKLPRTALIDLINDNDVDKVNFMMAELEDNAIALYGFAIESNYASLLKYIEGHKFELSSNPLRPLFKIYY